MRFKFTIFLLVANLALFAAIWGLERDASPDAPERRAMAPITVLEIEGKSVEKPRVLRLENNRWRIVSPIDWPANLFAVNRIINQLEFLEKETGFAAAEAIKRGHGLAEYGLDDPAYVFKYGNGEKMYSLKVGKGAPVGNRIYLFDSLSDRIVVVDKEFVDGLIVDMERLRNQLVFDIPRFEVSAFSVRLPIAASPADPKTNFLRVGLVRDGGKWKMETPIAAAADPREVDAFLDEICRVCAMGFPQDATLSEAGFDGGTLPASVTLQGTNRRQVRLIGSKTKDGAQVYARLEDNPTLFTLDAAFLKNLENLQTKLRDKSFFRFDAERATALEISKGGRTVSFHKLAGGLWDVVGNAGGKGATASADLAAVSDVLNKLSKVRARTFVSDSAANFSRYGIGPDCLRITVTRDDGGSDSIQIGSEYDDAGEPLMYAKPGSGSAVYGISKELAAAASTDFLKYRSKALWSLPAAAEISSVKIARLPDSAAVFEVRSSGAATVADAIKKLPPRDAEAARALVAAAKSFSVSEYLPQKFSADGVSAGGKKLPWAYSVSFSADLPGADAASVKTREIFLTERVGGTRQYGGSRSDDAVFVPSQDFIDAAFEIVSKRSEPSELKKDPPVPPSE